MRHLSIISVNIHDIDSSERHLIVLNILVCFELTNYILYTITIGVFLGQCKHRHVEFLENDILSYYFSFVQDFDNQVTVI